MKRLYGMTVLACGLMAGLPAAHAADIIEEPPVYIEEEKPDYSAWYIRGDVGYVFKSKTSGHYAFWNPDPVATGIDDEFHYDSIAYDNAYSLGIGAGFRVADHFRVDATLDRFKADVNGTSSCISYVTASMGLAWDNDCHYKDKADATVWTAMANAYVDLPYFGPVTPYFGAGAGFAHVSYGKMRNEQVCGSDPACPAENFVGYHEGKDSWRFASSLMAGATLDITHQLKLDAGYRYTRVFGGDAFGYDEHDTATGAKGVQSQDHGFNVHAVRAGLRYEFN